jgi:hypothetical protein
MGAQKAGEKVGTAIFRKRRKLAKNFRAQSAGWDKSTRLDGVIWL